MANNQDNTTAQGLALLQVLAILALALSGQYPTDVWSIGLLWTGLLLGVWALLIKRLQVSILPDPTPGMTLITKGPYRFIRHPMYLALLLAGAGWIVHETSIWVWGIWVLLLLVLVIKINREEQALTKTFKQYRAYQKRSWRLLPPIY